ncbi:LPP20 family lipoprotein [Lebetimonas sp. JH369]|uniref:LPP20 family lipoprotein n=1 Tax=Lebetimonas sp. JH369 TaxID=990069 RepID=UPI0004B9D3DF|nr:LPP20 family lipoprotein [Lebetimonas sp. JH369]
MIKKIILTVSLLFIGCAGTKVTNKNTEPVSKKVAVSKEYNENIILNKPESKKSDILTLYVTGEGVAPVDALNAAQAKILARRAAIADAYRQLAEKMYGVKVNAKETVKDLMLKNSDVNTYVEGVIRGADIQAEKFEDGIYYVTMNLKLDVRMWNKFINNN